MFEKSLEDMTEEDWDRMMAVNLRAPAFLCKALVPQMRQRGGGSIINIGSIEGIGSNPEHAAYCASKAGIHGLTKALAVDLGRDNIRCNAIAPGWINTELSNTYLANQADPYAARQCPPVTSPGWTHRNAGGHRKNCGFPGLRIIGLYHRASAGGGRRSHGKTATAFLIESARLATEGATHPPPLQVAPHAHSLDLFAEGIALRPWRFVLYQVVPIGTFFAAFISGVIAQWQSS